MQIFIGKNTKDLYIMNATGLKKYCKSDGKTPCVCTYENMCGNDA